MKRIYISILVLYLVVVCLFVFLGHSSGPDYKYLIGVSCKIDACAGTGSGVFVVRQVGTKDHVFVWTAGHVVKCAMNEDGTFNKVLVEGNNGKEFKAEIIAYSEKKDLALLELCDENLTAKSAVFYRSDKEIEPGVELIHVGACLGLNDSVSTGVMSNVNLKFSGENEIFDQTSTLAYPGSSGGGVFLKNGECIGLITGGAGPGLNFIIPVRRMRAWARSEGIEWALDASIPIPVRVRRPVDNE